MNSLTKFTIQKLDERMNGHRIFSHRIKVYWKDDFLKLRQWMIDSFGLGCELNLFDVNIVSELGYTWAWDANINRPMLYLTEEQLSAFILFNT